MRAALVVLLLGVVPVLAALAEDEERQDAWTLAPMTPGVRLASLETMESAPPQFALTLEVDMPEPQWRLEAEVGKPDADGRILVRLKGTRPADVLLPQVITPTPVRVTLGALPARRLLVDVVLKTDERPYTPVGALLLDAAGG